MKKRNWKNYRIHEDFKIYKESIFGIKNNVSCWSNNPWFTSKFVIETLLEDGEIQRRSFTWKQISTLIIEDQMKYMKKYLPDLTQKEQKSFLLYFFPFGQKTNTPYQSWLKARRQIFGS